MARNKPAVRCLLLFLAACNFLGCASMQEHCRQGWGNGMYCREVIRVDRDMIDLQSPFFISKKTLIADPVRGVAGDRGTKISFPVVLNASAFSSFTFMPDSLVMDGTRQHSTCVMVNGSVTRSEILKDKMIRDEIQEKLDAQSKKRLDNQMREDGSDTAAQRTAAEKSGTTLALTDTVTTGDFTLVCKEFVPYWGKHYRLDFKIAAVRRSNDSIVVMPGRINFVSAYDGWLVSPTVGLSLSLAFILAGVGKAYDN